MPRGLSVRCQMLGFLHVPCDGDPGLDRCHPSVCPARAVLPELSTPAAPRTSLRAPLQLAEPGFAADGEKGVLGNWMAYLEISPRHLYLCY